MMIRTKKDDASDTVVVQPGAERLTAANALQFKSEVVDVIDGGESRLAIDLTEVAFIDSSGIGALVGVLKKLGNRGDIVVFGLSKDVQRMFEITRMNRVFPAYKDRSTALGAMADGL